MKIAEYMTASLSPPVSVSVRAIHGGVEVFIPGMLEPIFVRPGITVAITTEQVSGNYSVPLRTSVVYLEPTDAQASAA
jgi:hypothetical protein